MFLATGNAAEAVMDAVLPALKADASLVALVTGIYGHVPRAERANHPYVSISDAALFQGDFGAMGRGGGRVVFSLDVWSSNAGSSAHGPHTVHEILARCLVVLERQDVSLTVGFTLASGSLHCTESRVFDEPDPEIPKESLYHGHQAWEALVDET